MNKDIFKKDGIHVNDTIIPWDVVLKEHAKSILSNSILLEFDFQYGRDSLYYHTLINKDQWTKIKNKIDELDISTINLGEICGKHSDVNYSFKHNKLKTIDDIELVSDFYIINGNCDKNCDVDVIDCILTLIHDMTGEYLDI